MRQPTMSATHRIDAAGRPLAPEPAQPKQREQITLPPARVEAYDPWMDAVNPEGLTEAARSTVPEHELAPWGWFKLRPETRAYLGGLAVLLLGEHPASPDEGAPGKENRRQRLERVYTLFGFALRGAYTQRADFERNQQTPAHVAAAARFYIENPTERAAATRHHQDLLSLGHSHIDLVKQLLRKLDGSRGVVAGLRELRKKLDAQLARLERRLGGGA